MKQTITITLLGMLFSSILSANSPKAFVYQDKPIDALCFSKLEQGRTKVTLSQCGITKSQFKLSGHNAELEKEGYIGYEWRDTKNKAIHGYSYYKVLPGNKNHHWLYTVNSGGGTGESTQLFWVKSSDAQTLDLQFTLGGDRCNRGIKAPVQEAKQLSISQNLTAVDLLTLSKPHDASIKAYDDLAACAVCCIARADYQLTADGSARLKHIHLSEATNTQEMPAQGKLQACFNRLMASYAKKGKTRLTPKAINKLVNEFKDKCKK